MTDPAPPGETRSDRAERRGSSSATFALRIAAIVLGFATNIAMARLLGIDGFGIFALVSSWVVLLSVPAMLGFDRLLVRDVAAFAARDEWARIRGLLRLADRVVVGLAVAAGLAMAAVGLLLGDPHGLQAPLAFVVGGLTIPLLAVMNLRQSATQGLHRVAQSLFPETVLRPGVMLVLIGGTLVLGVAASPPLGIALAMIAAGAAAAAGVIGLRSYLGSQRTGTPIAPTGWARSAVPFAHVATMGMIIGQADLVVTGLLLSPADAGAYAVALRGAMLASLPLVVMNATVAPTFSRLWARQDIQGMQRVASSAVRNGTLLTSVIAAALILFGSQFLSLFGAGFETGGSALAVLAIGRVVGIAMGPTGMLLAMTGGERVSALSVTVGAAVEIAGALLLIPIAGLVGGAVASVAAIVATNALQLAYVRRRLGIRPTVLGV
jgi:O-antigen/teichoic acid export membrane protein